MQRRAIALVVGINYYEKSKMLHGCVNDAKSMKKVLSRHSDGSKNFEVQLCIAETKQQAINRKSLKEKVEKLFKKKADIVLFYFSGHGYIENSGGYLITSTNQHGDEGLPLNDILQMANESPARDKIIVLDCCHSGYAGKTSLKANSSTLAEGLTILTASSESEYALEKNGAGVFTSLLVDALNGSAADLLGNITPGSVYTHIDQSLGLWMQRPIFKTNVTNFTSLRQVEPSIQLIDLRRITEFFPYKKYIFPLNPTFEPERFSGEESTVPLAVQENIEKFKILQRYNRVNLVVPVDALHMYHAAMESKGCKLTVLGKFYWHLVSKEMI